jgi:Tol biopolymer transport system component
MARQLGPVGYRDPAAAISFDGKWLAYSEGRFLRIRPVDGGPAVDLEPGEAQIRNLAWSPDNRTLLADGYQTQTGWATYDLVTRRRRPLWPNRSQLSAKLGETGPDTSTRVSDLRQPAWSPDGSSIAAVVNGRVGPELWIVAADGSSARAQRFDHRIAFPAWTHNGTVACVATTDGRSRVTLPCGGPPVLTAPDLDAYGPIAFAPDDGTVYVGMPNSSGSLDLWAAPVRSGRARPITSFSRDSYAPSVATDGTVLFKVQSYRTVVAVAPSEGGPAMPLATFQSETPSWDPTGRLIGITYGTWRRVVDDAKYPDIAQDAGIIPADPEHPADAPSTVVHASQSEDQSLCWSPNGRWIAFHSHKDQSDDIWLQPAAGDAKPRRVSFLGRGAEAGWPRWSPDGKWVLFTGASRTTRRQAMYAIAIDQEKGEVPGIVREISVRDLEADISHAEWLPDSQHVVALAKQGPGKHVIFVASREGDEVRVVHEFGSEHDSPGLGISPDGKQVAFIAPAPDGFFQVFRIPIADGDPVQVTTDRSDKTQPAWSPDGRRIAFTVWSYEAQFWRIQPPAAAATTASAR